MNPVSPYVVNPIPFPVVNLIPAYPEIFLLIAGSAILLIDMFVGDRRRLTTYWLSIATLVVCAVLNGLYLVGGTTDYTFGDMFVGDPMANLLKLATSIAMIATLVYSHDYLVDRGIVSGQRGGEFYPLVLFAVLGQFVMISANSFLSIYLGLELMSLAFYALVALRRDHSASTEAAMKYFILGALSSGFLLYGMSMLYGATGTLDLTTLARQLDAGIANRTILVFGLVFVVAGLGFKLGAVPFHMWIPDVYQGAPSAVTLVVGGAPKLAAFAIVLRLLVEGMISLAFDWQQMLMILAVLSLALGNLAAIAQTSVKRMLGYSTISHMGFLLLGMLSGIINGNAYSAVSAYSASLFYAVVYALTTCAAFGVLLAMSRNGYEADHIDDFKGLGKRNPWAAVVMMLTMFSLAGVPPTVGFYAKFSVLSAAFATGQVWLVVFAVLMSLIGAFYYLRIVKLMYFDEPVESAAIAGARSGRLDARIVLVVNGAALLVLGLLPDGLMQACVSAMARTLSS
ncbi:MAG: NADH-quinone oxidoreductase subunit NuoN [Burkholderiaceae bacterium]